MQWTYTISILYIIHALLAQYTNQFQKISIKNDSNSSSINAQGLLGITNLLGDKYWTDKSCSSSSSDSSSDKENESDCQNNDWCESIIRIDNNSKCKTDRASDEDKHELNSIKSHSKTIKRSNEDQSIVDSQFSQDEMDLLNTKNKIDEWKNKVNSKKTFVSGKKLINTDNFKFRFNWSPKFPKSKFLDKLLRSTDNRKDSSIDESGDSNDSNDDDDDEFDSSDEFSNTKLVKSSKSTFTSSEQNFLEDYFPTSIWNPFIITSIITVTKVLTISPTTTVHHELAVPTKIYTDSDSGKTEAPDVASSRITSTEFTTPSTSSFIRSYLPNGVDEAPVKSTVSLPIVSKVKSSSFINPTKVLSDFNSLNTPAFEIPTPTITEPIDSHTTLKSIRSDTHLPKSRPTIHPKQLLSRINSMLINTKSDLYSTSSSTPPKTTKRIEVTTYHSFPTDFERANSIILTTSPTDEFSTKVQKGSTAEITYSIVITNSNFPRPVFKSKTTSYENVPLIEKEKSHEIPSNADLKLDSSFITSPNSGSKYDSKIVDGSYGKILTPKSYQTLTTHEAQSRWSNEYEIAVPASPEPLPTEFVSLRSDFNITPTAESQVSIPEAQILSSSTVQDISNNEPKGIPSSTIDINSSPSQITEPTNDNEPFVESVPNTTEQDYFQKWKSKLEKYLIPTVQTKSSKHDNEGSNTKTCETKSIQLIEADDGHLIIGKASKIPLAPVTSVITTTAAASSSIYSSSPSLIYSTFSSLDIDSDSELMSILPILGTTVVLSETTVVLSQTSFPTIRNKTSKSRFKSKIKMKSSNQLNNHTFASTLDSISLSTPPHTKFELSTNLISPVSKITTAEIRNVTFDTNEADAYSFTGVVLPKNQFTWKSMSSIPSNSKDYIIGILIMSITGLILLL
ncbi:uncharacterized protein KGF55_001173 [Candida pseudojiufengensis]|uniref:uncharacterized protein n=1 Tax=Candida pseudojiufengensis TaxID=497109 RepID=UPI002224D871|nr:uncharacterized protein KGF55_001173 [Candida pseudojiufengensis]KAI5965810.1 hypothetical protein KGF55_001173 [Candida pseudojiufengensis]